MTELPAGRELDALVAEKVMGLKPGDDFGEKANHEWADAWDVDDNPSMNFYCRRCWTYADERLTGPCFDNPQPYSTNIAAAWTVVERLMELGCNHFSLEWERPEDYRPRWQREQQPQDRPWLYGMNAPRHLSGSMSIGMPDPVVLHAETMPLALCWAALRVLG